MRELKSSMLPPCEVDEVDYARAREYALLAIVLSHSPGAHMLGQLALLRADETPLGRAHALLAKAAGRASEQSAAKEYFDLFIGLGQGQWLPYASHYLTGSLYSRPLASLRETFRRLGVERTMPPEPEDHVSILCEVMAGLIVGDIPAQPDADREFFESYLAPWAERFFVDLENAKSAHFYACVGLLGRTFMGIESEGYALSA